MYVFVGRFYYIFIYQFILPNNILISLMFLGFFTFLKYFFYVHPEQFYHYRLFLHLTIVLKTIQIEIFLYFFLIILSTSFRKLKENLVMFISRFCISNYIIVSKFNLFPIKSPHIFFTTFAIIIGEFVDPIFILLNS